MQFYRSDRSLTRYGLACGYVDTFYVGDLRVELYQEHGCYHVRIALHGRQWLTWESSRSLTEARRIYSASRALARWAVRGAEKEGASSGR